MTTFKTAFDLFKDKLPKIGFQVPSIDSMLCGGLRLRGITEIAGEAGSGKSQLAMNLCLTTQLPLEMGGIGTKSLYISTEGPLATERLLRMARTLIEKHELNVTATQMMDNVIYISVMEYDDLYNLIVNRLERLLETEPVGLVIIDSIAAIFRIEERYAERSQDLRSLVVTLQHLGKKYDFATVCINQVRNDLESEEVGPTLGLSWANLVTTRLQIYKQPSMKQGDTVLRQKRVLRVIWAPNLRKNDEATFYINENGIL
ncbi:uncharacterized protein LOC134835963 [Culicoides brevitarsis]|uniref:uncharacterized protein LOC134835963 n=1 Tax=Culicoides brevitarsis TaxID=469753 RepID=UPI00307B97D6